jgi:gas vesicle protein
MEPQFEELAQRLKSDLAPVIADQLKSNLAPILADQLKRELAPVLADQLTRDLAPVLVDQLKSELSTVVAEQFAAAESRLVGEYKIHAEEMKAEVKLAAEGYAATLEGIDRSLKELTSKWDTKITDHDLVLSNHAKRIEILEQRS